MTFYDPYISACIRQNFIVKCIILTIIAFPIIALITLKNCILLILPTSWLEYIRKDVKGKIVLITGGGGGLGQAIAVALAKRGARIVSWDISEKGNEETAQIIRNNGGECHIHKVDISNKEMIYSKASTVIADIGNVDILINNAGITGGKDWIPNIKDEQLARTMDINFFSHTWMVNAFLPGMIKSNSGHIVSVSSLSGLFGQHFVEYTCSKFAICGFIESIRLQLDILGHDNIHTTLICPSFIDTPLLTKEFGGVPKMSIDYATEQLVDGILLNRENILIPTLVNILPLIKSISPTYLLKISYKLLCWNTEEMKKTL